MGKPPHPAPYDGSMERNRGGRPRHPDVLTPAEWRVLEALREGGTNAEIAARLGVSTNTVRYHVSNMLAKLELRDRRALAAWRPEGHRGRLGALFALPAAVWSVGRPLAWVGVGAAVLAGVVVVAVALVALEALVEDNSSPRPGLDGMTEDDGDRPAAVGLLATPTPNVTPSAEVPPSRSPMEPALATRRDVTPTVTQTPAAPVAATLTPIPTSTATPTPTPTPTLTPEVLLTPEGGSDIDVMVLYTPSAKYRVGGRAAIEARIDEFVAETNEAFANSEVVHRIRLVTSKEVNYAEDPLAKEQNSTAVVRARLSDNSDGHMDEVHEWRDFYAADIVGLLSGNDWGGGAGPGHFFVTNALTVNGVFGVSRSFAHEVGHIMGLLHDRYVVVEAQSEPGSASNFGYVNQRAFDPGAPDSAGWTTIMAYFNQCRDAGIRCTQIPYFSNPRLSHEGAPLGVPADHPSTGVDGPADAARHLNEVGASVADYRAGAAHGPRAHLRMSQYWLAEDGGRVAVTARIHKPSGADTIVTVSAVTPAGAVTVSANRTLTIPAGQMESSDSVTITGIDNDTPTGDVRVTVSAQATTGSPDGVIDPEPAGITIADDETIPAVSLVLSRTEVRTGTEDRPARRTRLTAKLDHTSTADTVVLVRVSPKTALSGALWQTNRILPAGAMRILIPAGQLSGTELHVEAAERLWAGATTIDVTISGSASNSQGIVKPKGVVLTIAGDPDTEPP